MGSLFYNIATANLEEIKGLLKDCGGEQATKGKIDQMIQQFSISRKLIQKGITVERLTEIIAALRYIQAESPLSAKKKKKKGSKSPYKRLRRLTIEEVLPHIGQEGKVDFEGHLVKCNSRRLVIFKESLACTTCGLKGSFFAVETFRRGNQQTPHLNLYALNDKGNEVLMTIDHIKPKSLGGGDEFENLQTMCAPCNSAKGSIPG